MGSMGFFFTSRGHESGVGLRLWFFFTAAGPHDNEHYSTSSTLTFAAPVKLMVIKTTYCSTVLLHC
jgi:hypothetical protein